MGEATALCYFPPALPGGGKQQGAGSRLLHTRIPRMRRGRPAEREGFFPDVLLLSWLSPRCRDCKRDYIASRKTTATASALALTWEEYKRGRYKLPCGEQYALAGPNVVGYLN